MNNFKKLLASAMALTMVTSVLPVVNPVHAADPFETVDIKGWTDNGTAGTVTKEDGKVVIGTGVGGAYNKTNQDKITEDGTSISAHVEVKNMTYGQLFQISAGVDNEEDNYVTEFSVMTQKTNDGYIVTSGLNPDALITLDDDGVYTYNWTFTKKGDNLDAIFTIENYGKEIGTIEVDNAAFVKSSGDVVKNANSIRYLWVFGRDLGSSEYVLDVPLTIYDELPPKESTEENSGIEAAINDKATVVELLNLLGDVTEINSDEVVRDNDTFRQVLTDSEAMLKNAYKYASVVGYDEEQTDALAHLVGTEIDDETKNAVEFANDLVSSEVVNYLKAYDGTVDADVVKEYNTIKALMAFKGNVRTSEEDTVATIEDLFADLEADVLDYKEDNVESDAKKFAKALVDQTVANGKTVGALVDDEAAISYTYRSSVESFLKKATRDSYTLDGVKYGDVKDEGVVADYIEALENIVTEMEEVKDLLDDTKAEKKAFDKLSSKISGLVDVIEKDYDDEDEFYDDLDAAVAKFRAADVEALKEYVETVVNEFWTVTTEQRTSGTYRVKTIDAGYGRYYGFENVAGEDLVTLMTTLVDEDAEETYYDLLVADAASIDELLDAVTTDIEGLTLSSTITNKDAARIIAAKKALTRIDADNQAIYKSLSRTERAAVDANRELINVLYVKLILNGNVVNDGWIDLGNGDWDYYVNGEAFTGWVCSAKDVWYYVSNGHMLRNAWVWRDATSAYYVGNDGVMLYGPATTPDGYTIDANGLWHA